MHDIRHTLDGCIDSNLQILPCAFNNVIIDPLEHEHITATLEAMEKRGVLNHSVIHGVFVGPARSGKNSIMERLLGIMPSVNSPSTGVAEAAIQVQVKKPVYISSTVVANVEGFIWSPMDNDDEAIRLMAMHSDPDCVLFDDYKEPADSEASPESATNSEIVIQDSAPSESIPIVSKPSIETARSIQFQDVLTHPIKEHPNNFVQPSDILKEAIHNKGLQDLQQHFQKDTTWSLYLTNTGGQMEFQDILPLLVSGPCMFFYTFRLDQKLSEHYVVEYCVSESDGDNPYAYTSSLTTIEGILQSLASIAAMGTFAYRGKDKQEVRLRPKIFFIGTHRDKLDIDSATNIIAKIDQDLQECTHQFHAIVEFASESSMIFTVNNFSKDETDFKNIRSAVQRVVDRQEFEMVSPSNWLIYSLVLRKLKPEVIPYQECLNIAKECDITEVSELDDALHFIHTKMGLIRYYAFDDLKDIVIIKPHFLYEKISDLIVKTFTFEKVGKHSADQFKQRGIFSLEDFERIERKSGTTSMKPLMFTKLLERLRIVAPFKIRDETFYFIPCALSHAKKSESHLELVSSSVPTLTLSFDHGYCPKGLGVALIQYLMTNEMKSDYAWKLLPDFIFRDQISFRVGPVDTVIFKITATHFLISLVPAYDHIDRKGCTIEKICMNVRAAIEAGVSTILHDINHIDVNFKFTFLCPCNLCCNNNPADIETYQDKPVCLTCNKSRRQFDLPSGYKKWYALESNVSMQQEEISQG